MPKETLIKVIVFGGAVGIVELAKIFIFKKDPKFKAIYTFAPIVLCAVGYLIVALIYKQPVLTNMVTGAILGLTSMGSYDAVATILAGWKDKSPSELAQEIADTLDRKEKKE